MELGNQFGIWRLWDRGASWGVVFRRWIRYRYPLMGGESRSIALLMTAARL